MAQPQEPWYHGPMTVERATKICAKVGQNGAFLVRESQAVKGAFTLSVFFQEEVYHHRIRMTSENKYHFEATKQVFPSLKDIVSYFMEPRQSGLIYPLTIAIYPSLIKQMDSDDQEWETNITVNEPMYEQSNYVSNSPKHYSSTPVSIPKPEHVYDKGVLSTFQPLPSQPVQNTASTEEGEDYWPAPPPCAWRKPEMKPKPKPKPKTKTSPFKPLEAFTHLFRKKKLQPAHQVNVNNNEQSTEPEQIYDNNEHCIPIICKTRFVATIDHYGQDGAMEFKKGTEMVIKGVRADGWWKCLNKATQESGWVFQDYLKPKSEGEWFEAKTVETNDDQRVYEKFNGDSDFDDDDENYCRYLLPTDDPSTVGKFP